MLNRKCLWSDSVIYYRHLISDGRYQDVWNRQDWRLIGLIGFLLILLFLVIFGAVQSVMYLKYDTTPSKEALKQIKKLQNSSVVRNLVADKQIQLRKMGAGILLKDQMTVSQWYIYKFLMAGLFFCICIFLTSIYRNTFVTFKKPCYFFIIKIFFFC